jgi:hypothetical protein
MVSFGQRWQSKRFGGVNAILSEENLIYRVLMAEKAHAVNTVQKARRSSQDA